MSVSIWLHPKASWTRLSPSGPERRWGPGSPVPPLLPSTLGRSSCSTESSCFSGPDSAQFSPSLFHLPLLSSLGAPQRLLSRDPSCPLSAPSGDAPRLQRSIPSLHPLWASVPSILPSLDHSLCLHLPPCGLCRASPRHALSCSHGKAGQVAVVGRGSLSWVRGANGASRGAWQMRH